MTISKDPIVAAVSSARTSLDLALVELEKIPSFDPNRIGYLAHALGNYLTVTMGTLDLLSASLEDHQDPEVHMWLSGLDQVTQRMSQSVQQLLACNSSDRTKLFFDKVDLGTLAQRAVTFYSKVAARKGICIEVSKTCSPAIVWTDRVATAVILDNLLSNAVKYSPTGKIVHVSLSSQKMEVVCTIQDEGPGISEIDQSKLFQRGIRLSAVPTGGETSTGFGLAIAREMVERLGGKIWYESGPGNGAKFVFALPAFNEQSHPIQVWLESAHEIPRPHSSERQRNLAVDGTDPVS